MTNRIASEGGDWDGDENQRISWLLEADRAGAAYIDVELQAVARLTEMPKRAKLVLSYHDFAGMGHDLPGKIETMFAAGATVAKVAVTPHDAADLDQLAELCARWGAHGQAKEANRGLIAIGMGEIGLPSRLLAGAWGSAWTFGRIDAEGSAPGQPMIVDLIKRFRVPDQGPDTRIFGVLGDPVGHSLSPVIHNAAFTADELDAVYVPFLAHDAVNFWRQCHSWIDGLSITIPHKTALIEEMDEIEELALKIGAINTIYRGENGQTIGANTDAPAAVDCIEQAAGNIGNRQVLVLGAGGVSRAIAFALKAAGADVTLANRTAARAQALADEVGCHWVPAEEALDQAYEVLVNGTSVGMESEESPWPLDQHRHGSVVFDTVYTPLETRLLQDAQAQGCVPICGLSMLIGQALGQYERWTGLQAPEPLMHRVALEAMNTRWTTRICKSHARILERGREEA
ncbi:MAG: type I 3-dehydroquinate dehydratase [Planctomycetota bacterium]|nr:type I 3-dehydroquinate dehydratase [Planctomycetota bacterium]